MDSEQKNMGVGAEAPPIDPVQATPVASEIAKRLRKICQDDPFGDRLCANDQDILLSAADICANAANAAVMKESLEKIAAMPPRLMPSQVIDQFIEMRLLAKAALGKEI